MGRNAELSAQVPVVAPAARTNGAAPTAFQRICRLSVEHHIWCSVVVLALIELVVFGPVVSRIGFYLDDWEMLAGLTFAKGGGFAKVLHYALAEPKIVIRPVEWFHFGTLFLLTGAKPALWHVFNGALEVLSAGLLYACLYRCTNNRVLSLIAAAAFLLSPIHDCTHYWVVASSGTLSIVSWLGSLLCAIEGAIRRRPGLFILSTLLFAVSLFNYECMLPLSFLNILAVYRIVEKGRVEGGERGAALPEFTRGSGVAHRHGVLDSPLKASSLLLAAYGSCLALYWLWSRVLVAYVSRSYSHAVQFSTSTMAHAVTEGIRINMPLVQWQFYSTQVRNAFDTASIPACLLVIVLLTAVAWLWNAGFEQKLSGSAEPCLPDASAGCDRLLSTGYVSTWQLVLLSVILVPVSYTIFGLNAEYVPNLASILNRINYGASVGCSLLYALAFCGLGSLIGGFRRPVMATAVAIGAASMFLSGSVLVDRALAKPWELSWTMQKHVSDLLKNNERTCLNATSLILLDSPRYVLWAPVFDGTWDFENLARIVLKNPNLKAGVASERMQCKPECVVDVSSDFICGAYPFHGMVAIDAPHSLLLPVDSPNQFIQCVSEHGFGFGLDRSLPDRWRKQLLSVSPPAAAPANVQ